MIQPSFKSLSITSLYLKDKDVSDLNLEEVASLFETIHEEVLEILSSKEQPRKVRSFPKSDLGL